MKIYAIEGVDGVGKSTVIENIKILFRDDMKYKILFTKQPFFNKKMLNVSEPFEKLYLFMADHHRHLEMLSHLDNHYDFTITDRYIHSRIAYQAYDIVKNYEIDETEAIKYIETLHTYTPKPKHVFLLLASENQLYERILSRQKEDDDKTNFDRINKIQDIYLKLASKDKKLFYVIYTDGLNPKTVAMSIKSRILKYLW